LNIDPESPVILFFGLLKPYKGLSVLLHSLAQVRQALPRVFLLVVGYDMGVRSKLGRLVEDLHVADHVIWRTQYVPSRDVSLYFAASDVVALPYLAGSSSAVLVTAYAYGKPVVATNVGGLNEMVEQGKTGIVVPASDFRALADALIQILREPERRAAMGDYARLLAQTRHSWHHIANQTDEVYQRLLSGGSLSAVEE
jgi:glycosyltransferase involved in cell wall biosynthesis